ncbi:MAG: GNAT family N-acetyltransferase [Candidatus Thorarchaeota archaeon]
MFSGFDFQVVVRAVIEGTSPGKIWVDDIRHPNVGFMASTEGWFLAGDPNKDEFNSGLKQLVHDMILKGEYYSPVNPEFLEELFFHIDSESWKERFSEIFDLRKPLPVNRIHYVCNRVILDWEEKIPEGYDLLPVDSNFDPNMYDFPEDVRERVAHAIEDQKKRGFGMCLIHENKVIVWIHADCASGDECEIGIVTTKDYRLKGLGSATAAAAVENCFALGYSTVGWHSEEHNYGSIGVAENVGFVKERDYRFYFCMFDEAVHFAESGMRYFLGGRHDDAVSEFEIGFGIGEVPSWAYVLAARSYGAIGNALRAKELLLQAKENGWSNWEPIVKSQELESVISPQEWDEILK